MAFDLHLIICTWDVVTTGIPVTVFFLLGVCGVWLCSKKKEKSVADFLYYKFSDAEVIPKSRGSRRYALKILRNGGRGL